MKRLGLYIPVANDKDNNDDGYESIDLEVIIHYLLFRLHCLDTNQKRLLFRLKQP